MAACKTQGSQSPLSTTFHSWWLSHSHAIDNKNFILFWKKSMPIKKGMSLWSGQTIIIEWGYNRITVYCTVRMTVETSQSWSCRASTPCRQPQSRGMLCCQGQYLSIPLCSLRRRLLDYSFLLNSHVYSCILEAKLKINTNLHASFTKWF